jgi:hypothetical protein
MFDSNHVQNDFIYQTGGSMLHTDACIGQIQKSYKVPFVVCWSIPCVFVQMGKHLSILFLEFWVFLWSIKAADPPPPPVWTGYLSAHVQTKSKPIKPTSPALARITHTHSLGPEQKAGERDSKEFIIISASNNMFPYSHHNLMHDVFFKKKNLAHRRLSFSVWKSLLYRRAFFRFLISGWHSRTWTLQLAWRCLYVSISDFHFRLDLSCLSRVRMALARPRDEHGICNVGTLHMSHHHGQFFNFNLFSKLFLKITHQKHYLQI